MVLLFGALKVTMWFGQRVVGRQMAYDASRPAAGSDTAPGAWSDPTRQPSAALRVLNE
jgi:hypothetical protein